MRGIARKLLGVVLVLAGIWCLSYPAPGVWQVKIVDLGEKYRERMSYTNRSATESGLDEYVRKETENSTKKVSGPVWEDIYARADQAGSTQSGYASYVYLAVSFKPMADMVDDENPYFMVELGGKYPGFLRVNLDSSHSAMFIEGVSWSATHPYAPLSPWLLGAGIMFYILIPWRKRKENEAVYIRWRSVIGPDILGVVLTGVFMVLPLFIITQITEHPRPLDFTRGENALCLIFWFMALIGTGCFFISIWYEALWFEITARGITKVDLRKSVFYPFEDMVEVKRFVWAPPGWLKKVAWLVVMMNPSLAGILLGTYSEVGGFEIPCRDGRLLRIFTRHLLGLEMILKALQGAGVKEPEPEEDTGQK